MSSDTRTSPGIGALPDVFSDYGGIVVDMVGTNGKRITGQVAPAGLMDGYDAIGVGQPWQKLCSFPGFSAGLSQLGGGIAQCNIRITLSNGDTGAPNPIYEQVFGANSMPFSGPYAMLPGCLPMVPGRNAFTQPPGWDFNAGTDLYLGLDVGTGAYINCGYMSDLTTYRLDSTGATDRTFIGFPGTWALVLSNIASLQSDPRYPAVVAAINALPAADNRQFAVTGWFSVPGGQLAALYSALLSNDVLKVGLWEVDPGYAFFDFTQGAGSNISMFAPAVISFTATPSTVTAQTEVVLAWSTDNVTSVTIDNNVGIAMAASGSKTVLVSATTTFTLTATGPAGTVTAMATVTYEQAALAIQSFAATPNGSGLSGHALLQWVVLNADRVEIDGVAVSGSSMFSVQPLGHSYALTAYQNYGTPQQTSATASATLVEAPAALKIATTSPLPVADSNHLTITPIAFTAAGGYGDYAFSAVSLPAGLALSPSGVLSGTLSAGPSTQYTFEVTVTDALLAAVVPAVTSSVTATFVLPFGLYPLAITTTQNDLSAAVARVEQPFLFQFESIYGGISQTWTLVDGSYLPPGVTLSSTGGLSGTPGDSGYWTFTVQVASGGETDQQTYELMVRLAWTATTPFQTIFYRIKDPATGAVLTDANGNLLCNDPSPDDTATVEVFGQMVVAFTVGTSDFKVTDIRQRGGGLDAADRDIPQAAGFWDLGYWDGKPYPLAGGLAVYLPEALLTNLTRDQITAKLMTILPMGTMPVVRYYSQDGEESL